MKNLEKIIWIILLAIGSITSFAYAVNASNTYSPVQAIAYAISGFVGCLILSSLLPKHANN